MAMLACMQVGKYDSLAYRALRFLYLACVWYYKYMPVLPTPDFVQKPVDALAMVKVDDVIALWSFGS